MEELIQQLTDKAGITPEQAQQVLETITQQDVQIISRIQKGVVYTESLSVSFLSESP